MSKIAEVARLFFRLGLTSFGGPAVHIAMMEEEVVRRREWMTREHFLDLVGATNLIPGPNSTEMAMHCGHVRAGLPGLVVAGLCFIVPAVCITVAIGYLYTEYGMLPQVQPFIQGIQPAVVSVVAAAVASLAPKAARSVPLVAIGVVSAALSLAGIPELWLLALGGIASVAAVYWQRGVTGVGIFMPLLQLPHPTIVTADGGSLFLIFLKVGSVLYGSGYVLFAFLETELVSTGLLSQSALIDAVAMGQITPGPVLSTAAFLGWVMGGAQGAALSSAGIFLPSFVFSGLLSAVLPHVRRVAWLGALLDGVNVASLGLLAATVLSMAVASMSSPGGAVIGIAALLVLLYRRTVNTVWVVSGGALLGYVFHLLQQG